MSHHKYHVEAIVIGILPRGEADLLVTLVCENLGVVRAVATGARLQKSKHRMSLTSGTHLQASLVRGKEVWRLTNIIFIENLAIGIKDKSKKILLAQIEVLLRKLAPHDLSPSGLFAIMKSLYDGLLSVSLNNLKCLEYIILLRFLYELGYLEGVEKWQKLVTSKEITNDDIEIMRGSLKEAVATINMALQSTHLS